MAVRVRYASPVVTVETFPVEGRDGARAEHVRFRMPDWVAVVALTPADEVLLVRQPRSGTGASHLEVPGGVVDPGEAPLAAATRELREETGATAERWWPLGHVFPNPALQDNRCFLFLAEGAVEVGPPAPDPLEALTRERLPWAEVESRIARGEVDHALSVVALQRVWLRRCGRMGP